MKLIERVDDRLLNLWAEKKMCELKHNDPDCPECAQADEIISEFQECKSTIEELEKGIAAVQGLIDDSAGVYGLHLNGDSAPWHSLLAGGFYEDWLIDFSAVAGEQQ